VERSGTPGYSESEASPEGAAEILVYDFVAGIPRFLSPFLGSLFEKQETPPGNPVAHHAQLYRFYV